MTLQPSMHANSSSPSFNRWTLLYPLLILIACIGTFYQVTHFEFTNWDDLDNIAHNPWMNPPSVAGVIYYWKHAAIRVYIPITCTAWSLIGVVASNPPQELDPAPYHAANLLVHSLNAIMVWLIIRRLAKSDLAGCLAALLFALHPAQVETVAWVSGLRDLLGCFFSLLCIWFYCQWIEQGILKRRAPLYVAAIACLWLAEFSKPTAVVLPGVLLVFDRMLAGGDWLASARRLIVPVISTVPAILITHAVQHTGSQGVTALFKPELAAEAAGFYIMKLIWPSPLVPIYGLMPPRLLVLRQYMIPPALLASAAIILRRRWPELAVGLIIFTIGLLPVLGFVDFDFEGNSVVADRYLYFPMLGIAMAIGCGLQRIPSRRVWSIAVAACSIAIVSCGCMSWRQADRWHDSVGLFSYNRSIVPDSWAVHMQLSGAYIRAGKGSQGLEESREALAEAPSSLRYMAYQHLGLCLMDMNQTEDAIPAFENSVRLEDSDVSRRDLAIAYSRAGRHQDAIQQLQILAAKNPEDQKVRNTLEAEKAQLQ